ncbi:hypothetical protein H0H81_000499 [Sphagnurus paluster]|uniref:DUF6535 domain-containing protein n=1 Tax=Sphagnurus paluster TaxID=117069 RepID=A0A9P7GGF2_9AGAR|nr:hypothetical protein H0H81_000499 [Sphagnurus paluster]
MGIDRSQETPALRTVNALFLSGLILSLMSASLAFLTARWLQRFTQDERDRFDVLFKENRHVRQRIWHRLYPRRLRRALKRRARASANVGQPMSVDSDRPGPTTRQGAEAAGAVDAPGVANPLVNAVDSWSEAAMIQGAEAASRSNIMVNASVSANVERLTSITSQGTEGRSIAGLERVIQARNMVDRSVNTDPERIQPLTTQDFEAGQSLAAVHSHSIVLVKPNPELAEPAKNQRIDAGQSPGAPAASGMNTPDVADLEGAKPTTSRGAEARKLPPAATVIHVHDFVSVSPLTADPERGAPPIGHPSSTDAGSAPAPTTGVAASIHSTLSFQDNLAHVYFAYSLFVPLVLLILGISEMIMGLLVFAWAEHTLAVALVLTATCLLVMPFLLGVFLVGGDSKKRDAIVDILSRKQGDW